MAERAEMNAGASGGSHPRRDEAATPDPASASSGSLAPQPSKPVTTRRNTASEGGKPKAGKKKPSWRETPSGRVLELLAYLIMLVLALVYFTGKGLFIYEGF